MKIEDSIPSAGAFMKLCCGGILKPKSGSLSDLGAKIPNCY